MNKGDVLSNLKLYGVIPPWGEDGSLVFYPPDLTGISCADVRIDVPGIVSLETNGTYPKAKLTLTAIERGVTQLKVKLKGGGGENGADLTPGLCSR